MTLTPDAISALQALGAGDGGRFYRLDPKDRKPAIQRGYVIWKPSKNPTTGWVITPQGLDFIQDFTRRSSQLH